MTAEQLEQKRLTRNRKAREQYQKRRETHIALVKDWQQRNYDRYREVQSQYYEKQRNGKPIRQRIHKHERVTPDMVIAIRQAFDGSYGHPGILAKQYNCSVATVRHIIANRTWKELPLCQVKFQGST